MTVSSTKDVLVLRRRWQGNGLFFIAVPPVMLLLLVFAANEASAFILFFILAGWLFWRVAWLVVGKIEIDEDEIRYTGLMEEGKLARDDIAGFRVYNGEREFVMKMSLVPLKGLVGCRNVDFDLCYGKAPMILAWAKENLTDLDALDDEREKEGKRTVFR